MILNYFELLSGEPSLLDKVGHIRSPKVKELFPSGIGETRYNFYLCLMSWGRDELLNFLDETGYKNSRLFRRDKIVVFDIITLVQTARQWYTDALSFFITEKVSWDTKNACFLVSNEDNKLVGLINRINFANVFQAILDANYLMSEQPPVVKHTNKETQELWERAQKYKKELEEKGKKKQEDNPKYHLSNIISKLCAYHSSYNLFNVGELTIFQLYDQFFQCGSIRLSDLVDNGYATHGGDKYGFDDWLNPINKNI